MSPENTASPARVCPLPANAPQVDAARMVLRDMGHDTLGVAGALNTLIAAQMRATPEAAQPLEMAAQRISDSVSALLGAVAAFLDNERVMLEAVPLRTAFATACDQARLPASVVVRCRDGRLVVKAHAALFARALTGLLWDAALRQATRLVIGARRRGGVVWVEIHDNGTGARLRADKFPVLEAVLAAQGLQALRKVRDSGTSVRIACQRSMRGW